jgi:type II pantothenate kinase
VDNAGADICLGCVPLVRWMLQKGSRVTLVANSGPALNDVTIPELTELLEQIAAIDASIASALSDGRLGSVSSGGWAPLLDLTDLSGDCVAAVGDADLIILHGMGRAVESNFEARFSCDVLRMAVLKDEAVAQRLGARLFDCVFQLQVAH